MKPSVDLKKALSKTLQSIDGWTIVGFLILVFAVRSSFPTLPESLLDMPGNVMGQTAISVENYLKTLKQLNPKHLSEKTQSDLANQLAVDSKTLRNYSLFIKDLSRQNISELSEKVDLNDSSLKHRKAVGNEVIIGEIQPPLSSDIASQAGLAFAPISILAVPKIENKSSKDLPHPTVESNDTNGYYKLFFQGLLFVVLVLGAMTPHTWHYYFPHKRKGKYLHYPSLQLGLFFLILSAAYVWNFLYPPFQMSKPIEIGAHFGTGVSLFQLLLKGA